MGMYSDLSIVAWTLQTPPPRPGYKWLPAPTVLSLKDNLAWIAVGSKVGDMGGLDFLRLVKSNGYYPRFGFEVIEDGGGIGEEMKEFVLSEMPQMMLTYSPDGGMTLNVVAGELPSFPLQN